MLIISLIIAVLLTGVDQVIKYLVVLNYEECAGYLKRYYTFSIGDFDVFSLTHIRNDGAGWSILGGQTWFLVVFTAVVMAAILVYLIVKRKTMPKLETIFLSLILAGGLGNLIDRIRMLIDPSFTGVIDYINFEFIDFPVFNFADMCVVIGGIGFCLLFVILEIKESKAKKALKKAGNVSNSLENQDVTENFDGGTDA